MLPFIAARVSFTAAFVVLNAAKASAPAVVVKAKVSPKNSRPGC
jgi:hypothetical protein